MLRDGRPPRGHGERMIANNYAAMQLITEWARSGEPFDPGHILELHRVVTAGRCTLTTLGGCRPSGSARLRVSRGGDRSRAAAGFRTAGTIQRLSEFEHERGESSGLHPLIRAILSTS